MMSLLLLFIGLLLILCEFYLPGAVMGILGGIFVLASIIHFASHSTSLLAISAFVFGAAVSVGLLIRFALWRIVKSKDDNSIYSDDNQEGYQASSYDKSAIGKTGVVVADLKPGGFIEIEGKQQSAISQSGYVVKGEEVLVVGGQEQSLIVISTRKGRSP